MTAIAPTAPIPKPGPPKYDAEERREELAMLEGHDANLPTEEQPIEVGEDFRANDGSTARKSSPSPASTDKEKLGDEEKGMIHTASEAEEKAQEAETGPPDPNIVDWEGPDDPENPMNWKSGLKWGIVATISSITFITYGFSLSAATNSIPLVLPDLMLQANHRAPHHRARLGGRRSIFSQSLTFDRPLASSMFAPGIPDVMSDFKSNNSELASFVVSVYVLGYAFGPLILAPLSELYGRLPVYHVCNVMFVVFTVACAVASNLNMLIGFRFLEGTFGSCPLTIGGGTIADMIPQQKRGGVMAIWALGPMMGPVIGPVIGGYLSQAKGWRWVFWLIAIIVSPPGRASPFMMTSQAHLSGWSNHHFSLHLFARVLPTSLARTQSEASPQADRQSGAAVEASIALHPTASIQDVDRPPHEAPLSLTYSPRPIYLHGSSLRLPVPSLHNHYGSLRGNVPLLVRHRWPHLFRSRSGLHRGFVNFRFCKRSHLESQVSRWGDEA